METIAGRRLFCTAAASAVGRHRAVLHRRGGAAADAENKTDAEDMIAVLKNAGALAAASVLEGAKAGSRGWRAAAASLFAASPLRHIATEKKYDLPRRPLAPGKHCLEVAYVCPGYEDEERVLEFMKHTFFRHEPTIVATGLSGRVPDSMLAMYRDSLREGLSVLAVNADDPSEILGVAINGPVRKGMDSKVLRNIEAENEEIRKVYDLWAYISERAEGWPDDLECVLEMKAIAIDPKIGRVGLAAKLTQMSRQLAKERFNFPAFRVDCTSLYSAKMTEKLCIPKVFCVRYKDYLDKKGRPVFKIPAPHTEVCVYVENFSAPQLPYDENC